MKKFDQFVKEMRLPDDELFVGLSRMPCPCCDGELVFTGTNTKGTLAFIECNGCKVCFVVGVCTAEPINIPRNSAAIRARARGE